MILPSYTPVVIIGAGPSGLMMAAQLLRQGQQPLIIDAKRGPGSGSRAIAIQSRTIEIFQQLGLHEQLLQEGNRVKGLVLQHGTEEAGRINLSNAGKEMTEFPFVLLLPQDKTERILLDYLTANACPVFWDTELISLQQNDRQVTLELKRDGQTVQVQCDWLVGADGAHSAVRNKLDIPFRGGTYRHQFYLADLVIRQKWDLDAIRIFFKDEGFAGYFPLGNDLFRFIGVLPKSLKGRDDLSYDDVRPFLTYTLDFSPQEESCEWFRTYFLHHRMADRFKKNRCFLIGDAAHIHSPVGGQGMNTGMQDAYNLAWKLSGVLTAAFSYRILDTYSSERMPVAHSLLSTTDRLFTLAVSRNWFVRNVRNWLLPLLVRKLWKNERVNERIFSMVSETAIHYRESRLSVHHSLGKHVRAGDRLPYIRFYDEKQKTETDLYSWCRKTGFTLIVMGTLSPRDLQALARWIKLNYPFTLNFYYLPYSERNEALFNCFEIHPEKRKAIIVRPDLHIGYINDVVHVDLIDFYLKDLMAS